MKDDYKDDYNRLMLAIKELQPSVGEKPAEVARFLNISHQNLNQWRTRGIPSAKTGEISALIGCSREWLERGTGALTLALPEPSNVSAGPDRRARVPLISWVQAGDWSHVADLLQPGEAEEWIDTSVTVRPHTFALRVEGDSMEPEFVAGTILVVEPEMDAHPGDYVVAKNGADEATFKQLVRDGADFYLKPLNPRYPIKPLGSARVIGVVREAVKRYR